jgi:AcrR family transcriptional regulator
MSTDAARIAVLRASDDLFYAHGISGVVMSDVRNASGVSMRRLYALYPSKS